MASVRTRKGIHHACFRYGGKQYERSLKTNDLEAADFALCEIKQTLYRLRTGQLEVPQHCPDVGDFILRGGQIAMDHQVENDAPIVATAVEDFLTSQQNRIAESYLESQQIHLRRWKASLSDADAVRLVAVTINDLEAYLQDRLQCRHPNTVIRERNTLRQFFGWCEERGLLAESPAAGLQPIRGGVDRPPFRTVAEIAAIIERGGLDDQELRSLWECLYLSPEEVAELLATVRSNSRDYRSFLLHAIPAYTGMRRGEVMRLRWLEVDLDGGYITARSRKQSRGQRETNRRIDIHPELTVELKAWQKRSKAGQFVVGGDDPNQGLTKDKANRLFWQPLRETTWCLDSKRNHFKIGFHSYRHSFASNLAAAGVDQRMIDEFMGHTTEAMRRRYRHLFPNDRREAMQAFSFAKKKNC